MAASFLLSDEILSTKEQVGLSVGEMESYRLAEAAAVQGPFVSLALGFFSAF